MKNFIRRWLGLDQIGKELANITLELVKLRSDLSVTLYAEDHPKRQEMSKEIGQRMISKLKAEEAVREKYGYKP